MNRRIHLPDEGEAISLPHPPAPVPTPAGFMMLCPIVLMPGMTLQQWSAQQWLYQCAYELAQAVARPSLPERDLLAVWN